MIEIKTAILSVYDKKGIVEFAKALKELNIKILSSGGTAKILKDNDIEVTEVSDYTDSSEMLEGRVKTLHPKIHAGILAKKDNCKHIKQLKEEKINFIDLIVVNFYPFEKIAGENAGDLEKVLENIDIGGPTMLRAAAKNFKNVVAVSSPYQYQDILDEIRAREGKISVNTSGKLALETFKLTSKYDSLIAGYLSGRRKEDKAEVLPENFNYEFEKVMDLRYGENPHQKAALYKLTNSTLQAPNIIDAEKLHGKQLSFNNILDLHVALESCLAFSEPAVSIVKHTNPCGLAVNRDIVRAYKGAYESDIVSAFGSIIGVNREVSKELAHMISKKFIECVIAPGYEKGTLEILRQKKNLRILKIDLKRDSEAQDYDFKKVGSGFLIQEEDIKEINEEDLDIVTEKKPSSEEIESLLFGWKVVKFVKSNAIVITKRTETIGIGAGQPSRIGAVKIAVSKAGKKTKGACLASDAFFPMTDSIEAAAESGITAIIQPGGSIRDREIIEAAHKHGIAMVFTGIRQFRH